MQKAKIAGRTMAEWQAEQPLLQDVVAMRGSMVVEYRLCLVG